MIMKTIIEKILGFFTRRILRKYNPDVVGITGSVGKTSVKDMAVSILESSFRVRGSIDSYNNKFGLPLTVIGEKSPGRSMVGWIKVLYTAMSLWLKRDKEYPEILVLEMGASQPGDIEYLVDMAPCDVGVVTSVSPVHMKFFKTARKVAQEKRWVISHLEKTGCAVLNRDDEEIFEMKKKTNADVISFGFHPQADVQGSDVSLRMASDGRWPEGLMFKVIYKGSIVPMYLPGVIGDHSAYPALASIAIGVTFGINLVDISKALQNVAVPAGRMRLLSGIKDSLILDDSYNASPLSMRAALQTLVQLSGSGKKYAVLGDMLELGRETDNSHREVGLRVAEVDLDFLITIGEAMKTAASAAKEAGLNEDHVASFSNTREAGRFLQEKIKSGDVVLIKGSRAMCMEKIVKEVMAEPLEADNLIFVSD